MEQKNDGVPTNIPAHNFTLESFAKAHDKMIATNDNSYNNYNGYDSWRARVQQLRDYSIDEIHRIISSGSLVEQQKLSRNYFYKDGYYKKIIIYYATLLKYMGILVPSPKSGTSLSSSHIQKRYYGALDYIDHMKLPSFLTNCALRALIDGSYYGVIVQVDKSTFSVLDLPSGYCQSRFKDLKGNDIIEFDITYFNTISDGTARNAALATYPSVIAKAYSNYVSGKKNASRWFKIPTDIGICFPFFDGRPMLLNVIPATIAYEDAVAIEHDRDAEDIRKLIVQQIPHLSDGRLLFEPDEAEEIHNGTVGMLKGNKNLSVLTTYADVSSIVSNTSKEAVDDVLTRNEQDIYAQAGVSGQLFAATGSASLETSLNNDLALMMYLADKFSVFITNTLNSLFANSNIEFAYKILPISYYNSESYIDESFKLANAGYSFLMPALALGLDQKELSNLKDLENNLLQLDKKLIPLQTSYTQSDKEQSEGGRPEKNEQDKTERTIETQESDDHLQKEYLNYG